MNTLLKTSVIALIGGLALTITEANAVTITSGSGANDATYTVLPTPPVEVLAYGDTGNLNGKTEGGQPKTWDSFLTSPEGTAYQYLGIQGLTVTGTTSGTWEINTAALTGFTKFALGLKSGNSWAVFSLNGQSSGTWSINKDLSHAALYAKVVPLPAAAYLFGSALLDSVVTRPEPRWRCSGSGRRPGMNRHSWRIGWQSHASA